ncbi:MAG TPA: TIGR03435 family protein [Acidobacteriaceae bacterium]|nr:TIGR03435 family protein [Acidobacteriaceae bacterium]
MTGRAVRISLAIGIGALAGIASTGQQPQPGKPLQFEVAAIKPGNTNHLGALTSTNGKLFQMVNVPLKQWVEMGLSVPDYELKAPAWLDTTTFDLNAKLPDELVAQKAPNQPVDEKAMAERQKVMADRQSAMAEMMRSLLIERFGLKWHDEQGTVAGYELVTDKKVLAQPASLVERLRGTGGAGWGRSTVSGTNMSMSRLAELLGLALGRPVVDATHLTGGYDIKLAWRPDSDAEVARQRQYGNGLDNLPDSAFTAVREQLGLRLQPAKVPGKVVIIDQINRQPAAN